MQPKTTGEPKVGSVMKISTDEFSGTPTIDGEWFFDGELSSAAKGLAVKPNATAEAKAMKGRLRFTFPGGGVAYSDFTAEAKIASAATEAKPPAKTNAARPGAKAEAPAEAAWPRLYGTGEERNGLLSRYDWKGADQPFYPLPVYEAKTPEFAGYDVRTGMGPRGEGFGPAAYAAFAGDDALDDMVLAAIRSGLKSGQEPSCQGGYSAQHEQPWHEMIWYATRTPRIWNKLSAAEQRAATLIAGKVALLAHAVAGRENADKFSKNLLGNSNSSTLVANTNIRMANRMCVLAGASVLGGAAQGKAFLDGITEAGIKALYEELMDLGLKNPAASFSPKRNDGAPTYAQMVAKANGWTTSGHGLDQPGKILATELSLAFSRKVALATQAQTTGPGKGSGRVLRAASDELKALVGLTAMLDEFLTMDMSGKFQVKGDRSSAEYGMKAMRVVIQGFAHALVSGLVSRTDPDVIEAYQRFKVGLAFFREITRDSVGWQSWAQAGQAQSGPWGWTLMTSGQSEQWGILPWLALGDVVVAIMDGKPVERHEASFFADAA